MCGSGPEIIEGSIVERQLNFIEKSEVTHLSGFTIEISYDQPLFFHFRNRRNGSLNQTEEVTLFSNSPRKHLNGLFGITCTTPQHTETVPLGTSSSRLPGVHFFNLLQPVKGHRGSGEELQGVLRYLKFIDPTERFDSSNALFFWFSHPEIVSEQALRDKCVLTLNNDRKKGAFLGNYYGTSPQNATIGMGSRATFHYSFDRLDAFIDEEAEATNSSEANGTHHHHHKKPKPCAHKTAVASALSEIESESTAGVMSRVMGGVVKVVVEGALDKMVPQFLKQNIVRTGKNTKDDLKGKTETNTNAEVPLQVAEMLDAALCYNLTNLITDSVTAAVSPRLANEIMVHVGFQTRAVAFREVEEKASSMISEVLKTTISSRLNDALPVMLHQALLPRLMSTLTRSVTHAVVPTLARSLTHTDDQSYYCSQCKTSKKFCNYCHYSPTSGYYGVYYSAYYTDYYSDYYGKYYGKALLTPRPSVL